MREATVRTIVDRPTRPRLTRTRRAQELLLGADVVAASVSVYSSHKFYIQMSPSRRTNDRVDGHADRPST